MMFRLTDGEKSERKEEKKGNIYERIKEYWGGERLAFI